MGSESTAIAESVDGEKGRISYSTSTRDKAWEDCNTEQYKNVRKSWAAVPIEHAQTS